MPKFSQVKEISSDPLVQKILKTNISPTSKHRSLEKKNRKKSEEQVKDNCGDITELLKGAKVSAPWCHTPYYPRTQIDCVTCFKPRGKGDRISPLWLGYIMW